MNINKKIFVSLLCCITILALVIPSAPHIEASPASIYIPDDYPTIQASVDAANPDNTNASQLNVTILGMLSPDINEWADYRGSILVGDYAYTIANNSSNLYVFHIANVTPQSPIPVIEPIYTLELAGTGACIARNGDTLYIGGMHSISVVDISTPSKPTLVKSLNADCYVSIKVQNNYLLAMGNESPSTIYDITDPQNPIYINNFGSSSETDAVIFQNNLYVSEWSVGGGAPHRDGIAVYSIDNLYDITETNFVPTTFYPYHIDIANDYLFLAGEDGSPYQGFVWSYSLANPILPTKIDGIDLDTIVRAFGLSQSYCVSQGELIDITIPSNLTVIGTFPGFLVDTGSGFPYDLSISGNKILIPGSFYALLLSVNQPISIDTTPPNTEITNGIINYDDVTFTWTGIDDTTTTSELVYSYYLEGHGSDWSDWTSDTSKEYVDLSDGDYTFRVKAKDEAGNVDASPAENSFTVSLPDLSIIGSLEFFNDEPPFEPSVLKVRALVTNKGNARAENVVVSFRLNGVLVGDNAVDIGVIDPEETKPAEILWRATSNVEDAILEVEAKPIGQDDYDLSNNTKTQSVSFFWVDSRYDPPGFRHDRDAFSFPNWYFGGPRDMYDELAMLFGSDSVARKLETIAGGWFLVWFSVGGHCYGMSSSSLHWYIAPEDKPIPIPTYNMTRDQREVEADIIEHHWSVVLPLLPTLDEALRNYNAQQQYERILEDIKGGVPVVLGLWEVKAKLVPTKGHAVIAYSILDLGNEKQVYVYDNELPLDLMQSAGIPANRAVFRLSSNEVEYPDCNRIVSVPTEYSFYTVSLSDLAEIAGARIKEFWDKGLKVLHIKSPVVCLFTDQFGRRIGYVEGAFVNEIPDAIMEQQLDSELFYLPADLDYSAEMIGTDTGLLGLDIVLPRSESSAMVLVFEDIPVTLNSNITMSLSAGNIVYEVMLDTGETIEPEGVGEIDVSDILGPASIDGLIANVELYYVMGWLKNAGIRNGLLAKLNAAQASLARGQTKVTMNQLAAFLNQVRSDENVDARAREYLVPYAQYVISNL